MKNFVGGVALVATSLWLVGAQIVIDQMYSTNWNYTKVQEFSNPQIEFKPGQRLTASIDSDKKAGTGDFIGIDIYDHQVHQIVDSFGGGITDSVAIVLQDFKSKHPEDYWDLLHLLFSNDAKWLEQGGIGVTAVRVPLGACDFGILPYTYDDTADGSEDPDFTNFNINKAPKLWKTLADITTVAPDLKIFAAPWSAPGWMKEDANENQPLFGGHLKEGYEELWAQYLNKSLVEIKQQKNLNVFALSLLNEPLIPELKYPTMKMTAVQAAKVGKLVRTKLDKMGFQNTKLVTWDFNWDTTDYATQVLDLEADSFDGVAWHGYAGKPEGQKIVSDAYPDKEVYFTEFTQITQYFNEPYKNMKDTTSNLLIKSIRYGSRSIILWNLVLRKDEDGFTTPHLQEVCDNCNAAILMLPEASDVDVKAASAASVAAATEGTSTTSKTEADPETSAERTQTRRRRRRGLSNPLLHRRATAHPTTLDPSTQAVMPQDVKDFKQTGTSRVYTTDYFKRSSDYSVLSHLSAAVRPQGSSPTYSRRIGVNTTEGDGRLLAQAFRQDGVKPGVTRFSVILSNQNDHYETGVFEDATAVISFRGWIANVTTGPGLYTFSWEAPTNADDMPVPSTSSNSPGSGSTDSKKDVPKAGGTQTGTTNGGTSKDNAGSGSGGTTITPTTKTETDASHKEEKDNKPGTSA